MEALKDFGLEDNQITTSGYYIYSYQEATEPVPMLNTEYVQCA